MLFVKGSSVLALLSVSQVIAGAALGRQRVLGPDTVRSTEANTMPSGGKEVRKRLKSAEIIPTVVDDFVPSLFLEARWSSVQAALGNTLKPKDLEDAPSVSLSGLSGLSGDHDYGVQVVITLTDPDAPSRKDPKWSEFCHWIATGRSLSPRQSRGAAKPPVFDVAGLDEVMPYKPPGPPEDTGKHRYVFLALVPNNGTTEKLHLSKPSDRQHWGYGTDDGETRGVREWAAENGLIPIAANFIYAKHR